MGTFITALVVFGSAALIVRNMVKRHRLAKISGSAGCGCGCSSCDGCNFAKPTK